MGPFRRIILSQMTNPTQAGARRIAILKDAAALCIAADSEVDALDVYPLGEFSPSQRYRVTPRRPLIGPLHFDDALVVPIHFHRVLQSSATQITPLQTLADGVVGATAIIEQHTDIHPSLFAPRPPVRYDFPGFIAIGGTSNFVFPAAGRGLISIAMHTLAGAGATVTLYGVDVSSDQPDGSLPTDIGTATALLGPTVMPGNTDLQWQYRGVPFEYFIIEAVTAGGMIIGVDCYDDGVT